LVITVNQAMTKGDTLVIEFEAKPPQTIKFNKDPDSTFSVDPEGSSDTLYAYKNYVFFDPNGQQTSDSLLLPQQVAGLMGVSKGTKILYNDYSEKKDPKANDIVPKYITGATKDSLKDIAGSDKKNFLYAAYSTTFYKSQPVVSLTKEAYKENNAGSNPVTASNRLFAKDTVTYKVTFTNTNDSGASGDINFDSVVDWLPKGQTYEEGSVEIPDHTNISAAPSEKNGR
jgi:uncharacterized repeat protein (TIGR01451 family)